MSPEQAAIDAASRAARDGMSADPPMTPAAIRAWKARMDLAAARIEAEEAETPHDPDRNRMIAEALAVEAWTRGWRPRHDPERAAEKIRVLRLLHGTAVRTPP